jgi:hypothetical protein
VFLRYLKRAFFVVICAIALVFALASTSKAQTPPPEALEFLPVTLNDLGIDIEINQNGIAQISETFTLNQFESQNFAFVLPKEGTSKIQIFRGDTLYKNYKIRKTHDLIILSNLNFSSSIWKIKYNAANFVRAKNSYDEFRFEAASAGNYVNNLKIVVRLPSPVDNLSELQTVHYAIHGITYSESRVASHSTLEYGARGLGPYSSYAAVAKIPKGIIHFSFFQRLDNALSNLSVFSWLLASLFLPFVTFVIMLLMIYKKKKEENIQALPQLISAPPENISPASVGVLYSGALGPREIAATIIDMAIRGYLFIVNGGPTEGYRFGERKSFLALAPHEQDLGKELLRGGLRRTLKEIEEEPQAEIFSATVSLIYQDIYKDIARLGYFVEDPEVVHLRYYFAGIGIFALSIIGFIIAAVSLPYPPYPLFGFFAMALSALVVMRMSRQMPVRTDTGKIALAKWLAFRNFLIAFQKPSYREVLQNIYFQYLPYAVVLGVEKKWASHFADAPFKNPEWYAAFQEFTSIPQFTADFYPIIDYIADIMESLREPTIK